MGGFFTISICLHLTQVVPRNFPDKAVENSDALPVWGARPGNFFALRQYLFTDLYAVDESVQDIAGKLFISRAALYRHISNLNEKTKTKSRVGLLQFYYEWNDK